MRERERERERERDELLCSSALMLDACVIGNLKANVTCAGKTQTGTLGNLTREKQAHGSTKDKLHFKKVKQRNYMRISERIIHDRHVPQNVRHVQNDKGVVDVQAILVDVHVVPVEVPVVWKCVSRFLLFGSLVLGLYASGLCSHRQVGTHRGSSCPANCRLGPVCLS